MCALPLVSAPRVVAEDVVPVCPAPVTRAAAEKEILDPWFGELLPSRHVRALRQERRLSYL